MQARDYRDLFLLAAIWGSSFLFMRLSVGEFGPLALVEIRVGASALFLLTVATLRGRLGAIWRHRRHIGVAGVFAAGLPFAAYNWPSTPVSLVSWSAALSLALLCTGLAYIIYYGLIDRIGATRSMTVTFLVPIFGILWGAVFLHEPLSGRMLA